MKAVAAKTTGTERADALLAAKVAANAKVYASLQAAPDSRQGERRAQFLATKRLHRRGPRKAPLIPKPARADRTNRNHLWLVLNGRTETYLHATKGLRTRFIGEA